MGSYKLVTGQRPERYNPDKQELHGLTKFLARYWNELVTTQVPSADEWECVDVLRDASLAHITVIAEDNNFDREKIRFVPFTEGPRLNFRAGTDSEYIRIMFERGEMFITEMDTCNHYLFFRKRKIVEEERKQKLEEFIEHYYW